MISLSTAFTIIRPFDSTSTSNRRYPIMKRLQHLLSALVALPLVRSRLQVDESTLPTPRGPLVWGDVNFIHTTDIHGRSRL
jgi:hypothetical protein